MFYHRYWRSSCIYVSINKWSTSHTCYLSSKRTVISNFFCMRKQALVYSGPTACTTHVDKSSISLVWKKQTGFSVCTWSAIFCLSKKKNQASQWHFKTEQAHSAVNQRASPPPPPSTPYAIYQRPSPTFFMYLFFIFAQTCSFIIIVIISIVTYVANASNVLQAVSQWDELFHQLPSLKCFFN